MVKKNICFNLLTLLLLSCGSAERVNISNPVSCMVDSITFDYYLTTTDNELTTTFYKDEGIVVHYDVSNSSSVHKTLAHDYVHAYVHGLHGKCYTKDGVLVPSMSFSPDKSLVYNNENDLFEINTLELSPHCIFQLERYLFVDIPAGEYYYETTPRLCLYYTRTGNIEGDTVTFLDISPLRVYFTVGN